MVYGTKGLVVINMSIALYLFGNAVTLPCTPQRNTRSSSPSIMIAMLCPYGMLVNLMSL